MPLHLACKACAAPCVSLLVAAHDATNAAPVSADNGGGENAGHARVYEWSAGGWQQMGADIDGEAAYDESGYSVSLSADGARLAVGAYVNDGGGDEAGHARVYE